jgi:asparagine synthase (glutamine-hydrolysing)
MCGLAGIVSVKAPPEMEELETAGALLRHRGPDSSGIMVDRRCGLVHRRLSILDVSDAGSQPMRADALRVWIAYNGEVYNYRSLREDLERRGWRFISGSDTEVVLKACIEWGTDALARLRGMYALAIWDTREGTLLLARDPFGIKPLYYAHLPGGDLAFGSEIKSLRAFSGVSAELDHAAFAQFLRYHYVPEPHSIYRSIHRLPAGHYLRWKNGAITIGLFQSPIRHERRGAASAQQSEQDLTQVLADSVAAHMISDVPVGVFLSGGVDSSLVAALMRRASGQRLHSFSIVFADRLKSADESEYARTVARHLDTDHHEVVIDDRVLESLPETLGFFDEPFANPAALIAARLSEFAASHVKVVLSGVGGDEFFGGYPRYVAVAARRALRVVPRGLSGLAVRAGGLLPASTDRKWMPDRLVRMLDAHNDLPQHFYDNLVAYSTPAQAAQVTNADFAAVQWRDEARLFDAREEDSGARAMDVDIACYLPGDLLTYTDRCAMAYSLEVRTPLIDLEVARAAASLAFNRKIHGFETKWMLKRIAARLVPPEVIYRQKKGFAVPIADWLRRDSRLVNGVLSPAHLRGLDELNPAGIKTIIRRHTDGDNTVAYLLWALLSYVTWRSSEASKCVVRHDIQPVMVS